MRHLRLVGAPAHSPGMVTLLDSFTQHMRVYGRRPTTVRLRRHYTSRWLEAHPDPWAVTPSMVTDWLDQPSWSDSTRRDAKASVRAFYQWAIVAGLTHSNPTSGLPAVRVPRALPRPIPDDHLVHALASASTRDRLMVELAAYAGLRRDEIARLPWAAARDDGLLIDGKGGRQRWVPMIEPLASLWAEVQGLRRRGLVEDGWRFRPDPVSPFVFPGARGKDHMHADAVGKIASGLLPAGWTLHTARHRYGTAAYRGSKDIRAVQELLGHQSPVTTQRYTLVDRADLWAAAEAAA